ncbi:MAG: inorganic diphosphatase [Aquificae bacterium]|nr:inorganic diphosphatase [Aquificota bacterium]
MEVKKIPPGKNPPEDVFVVVEIPKGSPVKYELDKESGALFVDRVLYTAMYYPFNYGFIPNTLADDGDPVDVLVVSEWAAVPGSVIRARVVGMLEMEDESGVDAKVVAVPHEKVDPTYASVRDVGDLPEAVLNKIKHFFERYKELEPGKWVKVRSFKGRQEALEEVRKAIENYKG